MKAYEIVGAGGIDALAVADRDVPQPGPYQVLIRIEASCINYRDLSTVLDPAARNIAYPRIPNSDGAGVVEAIGEGVTRHKVGDRVIGCFFEHWVDGQISPAAMQSALGGPVDGMLCQYRVLHEEGVVSAPTHLSSAEASTLACAALTAWHSVVELAQIKAGQTVLLLGTGGVSVFALQFAALHGARVIHLSSSDEKLARVRELGAWQTVNYVKTPGWDQAVIEMTDGVGVDHVVEVGGAGTLERSLASVRVGGSVGLIGVLTGGSINPTVIMRKSVRLQGIYVGNRAMFERMSRAVQSAMLKPIIHETFSFEDARQGYHAMKGAQHLGKLVVTL